MKYLAAPALVAALLFSSACTQSPQKLVEAGNRYHAKKKYKEASILYQKAITKDKTNAEAYYRQGLNLLDSGDVGGSASYLRRAVDLKPTNSDAATKLAEIYLMAYAQNPNRFKQLLPDVRDLVAKVSKYQPNSFSGLRLQGLLALAENDPEKALQAFAQANKVQPYSPDVVSWYAETLYNAKRVDEAVALERDMLAHNKKWGPAYDFLFLVYTRAGQKDKASEILAERVQNDPTNAIAVQNLANYQVISGDYNAGEATAKRVLADPKAFPNRHELLGDFYFRNNKLDQALQQYQAGVTEDPKNAVLYKIRIVGLDQAINRHDDALQLARALAKENPKNNQVSELYAGLLLQGGSRDKVTVTKSLDELTTMAKNNPLDPLLHLDLARAYYDTNDKDKSLSEAQTALEDESKAAQTAVPRHQPRPAVIYASRIIIGRIYQERGQHAKAMEQANLVLQGDPKNPDARLIKAIAMVGMGQGDQALPELEALVQQYPSMPTARLELAAMYLERRDFDRATAQFQQFEKMYPADLRGMVGLENVKLAQGNSEDAINGMQALVKQRPNDLQLRYQLANFQAEAGARISAKDRNRAVQLFQDAANNYKEILKTTANSADVWLRLGILQRELKQNDAALASFEQANRADSHNSAALLNEGMLLEDMGKKKEAVTAYNKVLGIDPENPLAMNNVAFLNAEDGVNLDQAMTFAEKAKQKVPNSPEISDTLGYVYYQKHLNTEALQIFRDLVAAHQDNPTFRFHLALALEKNGDKGAARDQARKALQSATNPQQQNQIKSFLDQLG